MALPKDPFMLLSVVNTKLRDEYDSVEAVAEAYDADAAEIIDRLAAAGYSYKADINQFV